MRLPVGSFAVLAFHDDLALAFQISPGGNLLYRDQTLGQHTAVAYVVQPITVTGQSVGQDIVGE